MTVKKTIWIVGQGGLLGSTIKDRAETEGFAVFPASKIPWFGSIQDISMTLDALLEKFLSSVENKPWQIIWAAGSSGVGSSPQSSDTESHSLSHLLRALAARPLPSGGSFYLCSSAGAIYARASDPPFTSDTIPATMNEYGILKMHMESEAISTLENVLPITIGRISNLYGPWLGQRQGLINRLCQAALDRSALNLFVSMDTIRDYIYTGDAADLIVNAQPPSLSSHQIEIVASGRNTTVSQAVATVSAVAHRKIPVTYGTNAVSLQQPKDIRLVPTWRNSKPDFSPVDLATGTQRVLMYMSTHQRTTSIHF